jgi:hypothetical protein
MVAFCYWLNRIFLRHFDWTIFEVVAIFLLEFLVNKFVSATSPTFYYEPTGTDYLDQLIFNKCSL